MYDPELRTKVDYLLKSGKENDLLKLLEGFIYSMACRYCHTLTEDILQECRISALYSIRKYDPDKGEFLTFCANYIRNGVFSGIKKLSYIKIPREALASRNKLRKFEKKFYSEFLREPTEEEIMGLCGLSLNEIKTAKLVEEAMSIKWEFIP